MFEGVFGHGPSQETQTPFAIVLKGNLICTALAYKERRRSVEIEKHGYPPDNVFIQWLEVRLYVAFKHFRTKSL